MFASQQGLGPASFWKMLPYNTQIIEYWCNKMFT